MKALEKKGLIRRSPNKSRAIELVSDDAGQPSGMPMVGVVAAGHSGVLASMAELRLPVESHPLQAYVSEPLKPLLDQVVVFGVGGAHFYISQSDKGGMVFGGDIDWYKSYAQRGNLPIVQDVAECATSIMPCVSRRPARPLR